MRLKLLIAVSILVNCLPNYLPISQAARPNMSFDFAKALLSIQQSPDSSASPELVQFLKQECDHKQQTSPVCRQIQIGKRLQQLESQINESKGPLETRRGWDVSDLLVGWWSKSSLAKTSTNPESLVAQYLVLKLAQLENLKEIKRKLSPLSNASVTQQQSGFLPKPSNGVYFEIFWALTLSQHSTQYLPGRAISFINSLQCSKIDELCLKAKNRLYHIIQYSLSKSYSRQEALKNFLEKRLSSQESNTAEPSSAQKTSEGHLPTLGVLSDDATLLQSLLSSLSSLPRLSSEQYLQELSNEASIQKIQEQILSSSRKIFSSKKDLEDANTVDLPGPNLAMALISTVHFFEVLQFENITPAEHTHDLKDLSDDEVQFKNIFESQIDQTFSSIEYFISQTEFEL